MLESTILVELQEYMGSDAAIANAAWTSTYNKDTRDGKYDDPEKVASVVRRLIMEGHGTPVESVIFRFWIRMPIFTDRQHMTHRVSCLAPDTKLYFDSLDKDCCRGESVADVYKKFIQNPQTIRDMKLKNCNEKTGDIEYTNVYNIWQTGEQPVYQITLGNGSSIKATENHRFLTEDGWKTLKEISPLTTNNDTEIKSNKKYPKFAIADTNNSKGLREVVSIKYIGIQPTYDLEVTGPYHNFIANGFVVHNSHNGLSGRYRTMPNDYFHIPQDVESIINKCELNKIIYDYEDSCARAFDHYENAITQLKQCVQSNVITNDEYKRAREIIRGQLPVAGMIERTTIINLRSFANYQRLRNSEHAQPEIRKVAQLMLEEVEKANICPVAIDTLKEIGWRV